MRALATIRRDLSILMPGFLLLLLVGDAALIGAHVVAVIWGGDAVDSAFLIDSEYGFGGLYQTLKQVWLLVLCGTLMLRRFSATMLTWSAISLYVLADDLLMIHEGIGNWALDRGLVGYHTAQVIWLSLVGAAALGLVLLSSRRATAAERRFSHVLLGFFAVYFAFAVVADVVHRAAAVAGMDLLDPLLDVIEEGGELVVLSVIVAYVASVVWARWLDEPSETRPAPWTSGAGGGGTSSAPVPVGGREPVS